MKRILLLTLLCICLPLVAQAQSPILSLSAPTTGFVDEPVLIDARASTNVCNKPQSNATPSFTLDFGDTIPGSSQKYTAELMASAHAYRTAGAYTIRVNGKSCAGTAGTEVTASITISEIPAATGLNTNDGAGQNVIDMTNAGGNAAYYIAPGSYSSGAANGTKLQAAITRARNNNSTAEQEIIAPAGATFNGPITLDTPVGSKYVTIKSSALASLAHLRRIVPATDTSFMPTILGLTADTANCTFRTPPTAPASPPHHYRLQGLHHKKDSDASYLANFVYLGTDYGGGQTVASKEPHHFIIDRNYFNGGNDSSDINSGIRVFSRDTSIVDSYFLDFKKPGGSGVDPSAISVGWSSGTLSVRNNTLIADGENFSVSGGVTEKWSATITNPTTTSATLSSVTGLEVDMNIAMPWSGSYGPLAPWPTTIVRSISGNNITFDAITQAPDNSGIAKWAKYLSFVEYRENYNYKPLKWRQYLANGTTQNPTWNGIFYLLKNSFEIKYGRYLVIDGNFFANHWRSGQDYMIVLNNRNSDGSFHQATSSRQLQFSNNILKTGANGIGANPSDDLTNYPDYGSQVSSDFYFRNNLLWDIGYGSDNTGTSHYMQNFLSGPQNYQFRRIFMIHNTWDDSGPGSGGVSGRAITDIGNSPSIGGSTDGIWHNNIAPLGWWQGSPNGPIRTDQSCALGFPPCDTTNYNKNLNVNPFPNVTFPPGGIQTATGSQTMAEFSAQFVDFPNGNFTVAATSLGKFAATDGTDIGINVPTLQAAIGASTAAFSTATLKVVTGDWSGAGPPPPTGPLVCRWSTSPGCIQQ